MIHIILGDDVGQSRKEFIRLKEDYKEKGYEIFNLDENNISELNKWLFQSSSLFFFKKVFFGESLLSKKEHREIFKKYDIKEKDIDFVFWEEKVEERAAKYYFKYAKIQKNQLPVNIFKFLDSIYPSNLSSAISFLNQISDNINENIILYMLQKRVRELILIKNNFQPEKKLADWQLYKLKSQAQKWDNQKLTAFYDSLYRIEVFSKTSVNYYSVKKALDILFCYYI